MESLWNQGRLSIREVQEAFPESERPAYTTIQSSVYRLEEKGALCDGSGRSATPTSLRLWYPGKEASGRLIDDLLSMFGGRSQPVMAHLAESGKLTVDDIRETEKLIRDLRRKK